MKTEIYLFFILFLSSCTFNVTEKGDESSILPDSLKQNNELIMGATPVSLTASANKEMKRWESYQNMENFIKRYYKISTSEALSNALELNQLAELLQDSIKKSPLASSALNARVNILFSETKRLADMNEIQAISKNEVDDQVHKITEAFASLQYKLNSLFAIDEMESQLKLDPDFQSILKDSMIDQQEHKKEITKKQKTELLLRKSRLKRLKKQ